MTGWIGGAIVAALIAAGAWSVWTEIREARRFRADMAAIHARLDANRARRHDAQEDNPVEDIRPRFGEIRHPDGSTSPIVFRPTDDPNVFEAVNAGDETSVQLAADCSMSADVIGPGQSITFHAGPSHV